MGGKLLRVSEKALAYEKLLIRLFTLDELTALGIMRLSDLDDCGATIVFLSAGCLLPKSSRL